MKRKASLAWLPTNTVGTAGGYFAEVETVEEELVGGLRAGPGSRPARGSRASGSRGWSEWPGAEPLDVAHDPCIGEVAGGLHHERGVAGVAELRVGTAQLVCPLVQSRSRLWP